MMATTSDIENVARVLRGGGLVALLTETVYGLAANAEDHVVGPEGRGTAPRTSPCRQAR